MNRLVLLSLVGALCPACALTNMTLVTPKLEMKPGADLGRGRAVVLAQPFVDARPFQRRCGMKKNGYNMDTADILCADPPHAWLAGAFGSALSTAGFRVLVPGDPAGVSAVRIDGTLAQFFLEPKVGGFTFSPEADIEVHLRATAASGLDAARKFYVKGIEVSMAGFEDNFRLAAEKAVRQLMTALVAAIANLLDQFPQLAGAGTMQLVARHEPIRRAR